MKSDNNDGWITPRISKALKANPAYPWALLQVREMVKRHQKEEEKSHARREARENAAMQWMILIASC